MTFVACSELLSFMLISGLHNIILVFLLENTFWGVVCSACIKNDETWWPITCLCLHGNSTRKLGQVRLRLENLCKQCVRACVLQMALCGNIPICRRVTLPKTFVKICTAATRQRKIWRSIFLITSTFTSTHLLNPPMRADLSALRLFVINVLVYPESQL